jgi:hypothetical protein
MKLKTTSNQESLAKVLLSFTLVTATVYYPVITMFDKNDQAYYPKITTNNFNPDNSPLFNNLNGEFDFLIKLKNRLIKLNNKQKADKRLAYLRNSNSHNYQKKSF